MRVRATKYDWTETPRNEFLCHELQTVIAAGADGWYAHPFAGGARIGPFATALHAQHAVEDRRVRERDARA